MTTQTRTDMVVDRSAHGELLRINFNLSFPQLSCEYATLDVSDAMGTVRSGGRGRGGLWGGRGRSRAEGVWGGGVEGGGVEAIAIGSRPPCRAGIAYPAARRPTRCPPPPICCRLPPARPQKRLNLTKTVRKQPINEGLERAGRLVEDREHHDPKYDEEHPVSRGELC